MYPVKNRGVHVPPQSEASKSWGARAPCPPPRTAYVASAFVEEQHRAPYTGSVSKESTMHVLCMK